MSRAAERARPNPVWLLVVVVMAGLAVAGPALMVRDQLADRAATPSAAEGAQLADELGAHVRLRDYNVITLRFLAEPTDVNFGGKVHGGAVMKWIDQAGYACAVGWSGQYCVTIYVGGIRFHRPVLIGNMVEVSAKLIHTGKTSLHVVVEVSAGDPKEGLYTKTTQCIIVFVAVDDGGTPVEVKRWEPESEQDIALEQYAKKLMELRKDTEKEIGPHGVVL
jgi:uncharacterized protein (TIGR00369 family)